MKTIKLMSISFAALLLGACNNNEVLPDGPENNGETLVSIVLANGTGSAPASRATDEGTEAERKISHLEFFIFDDQGVPDGKTPYLKLDAFARKTTLHIASAGNVNFVVVANYGGADLASVADYSELQTKLAEREMTADGGLLNHNAMVVPTDGFEMSGETVAVITAGSAGNTATVKLDRIVSKFDKPEFSTASLVNLPDEDIAELWGAEATVTNDQIEFTFEGYALINGVNKSLLLYRGDWEDTTPPATIWRDEWVTWFENNQAPPASLKYLTSGFDVNGLYENNYSGLGDDGSWFIGSDNENPVYVYENAPKEISTQSGDGYDPQTVYAFIVKGTLAVEGEDGSEVTRYWRINLHKDYNYVISRNNLYKVLVTSIKSCGFATPEEAETGQPVVPLEDETYVDVIVTINPWNVINSSSEM